MDDVTAPVAALIGRVVDIDPGELTAASRFEQIDGWSSVAALALMVEIEELWPVTLDLRAFMGVQTVGELAQLVSRDLPPGGSS